MFCRQAGGLYRKDEGALQTEGLVSSAYISPHFKRGPLGIIIIAGGLSGEPGFGALLWRYLKKRKLFCEWPHSWVYCLVMGMS